MNGWIEVPKIGSVRVSAIVRVGEVNGGDSVNKGYTVYLSNGHIFGVLEHDMTRESFMSLMVWEDGLISNSP